MRDIIFQELRECNKMILQNNDAEKREEGTKILIEIVEKLCELTYICRKEGLLALEEAVYDVDDIYNGRYLKSMIMLIVDGTEPELVEEISTARFFSTNLSGYDALHYIVMMFGCLAIQAGENPRIIKEKLLSLIPYEAVDIYMQKQKEAEESKPVQDDELKLKILEECYTGGIAAIPGDDYYFQIKVTDYAIKSLDDRNIQRVLRDVDNCDLAVAMKGLSGDARRRLFSNLSSRLAIMIKEDMEFMGPVRMKDVSSAVLKIYNIIIRLIRSGEITSVDGEALCAFGKIFETVEDEAMRRNTDEAESELYKIMKEYKSASHKIIDTPWKNL